MRLPPQGELSIGVIAMFNPYAYEMVIQRQSQIKLEVAQTRLLLTAAQRWLRSRVQTAQIRHEGEPRVLSEVKNQGSAGGLGEIDVA